MTTEQARRGPRPWAPLPPNLSEKAWQQVVLDLAGWRGWRRYHTFDSRRSTAGWPDLALVRRGRLLLVELKTERGRVTPQQARWLADLSACPGIEVHVWRPSAWPSVQEVLA